MPTSKAANIGKATQPRVGKDHLNLADWRISVPTFQQPRSKDGGTVDFVEYVIPRAGGSHQRVTLESPSRIGLPTAGDEDVVLALLALAKQQKFASDLVRFVPARLLEVLRWPTNQGGYVRLKAALKRLKAVTVTYEHAWYSRRKGSTEPVLITGILAEAKLVLRRGRPAKQAVPDSYVQWTKNFFDSLQQGNLTDLDLDLYYSCNRPGARHLYRHLNKVWHAGKKPRTYERDLTDLACGHLGMTQSKDLKRNFAALVSELERRRYIEPMPPQQRYRKVRPGVWRVRFDLHPTNNRKTPKREEGSQPGGTKVSGHSKDAATLVSQYHRQRFDRTDYQPTPKELSHATQLLNRADLATLSRLVPAVAQSMQQSFGNDLYFGAAVPLFLKAIDTHQREKAASQKRERERHHREKMKEDAEQRKQERKAAKHKWLTHWQALSAQQKRHYRDAALEHAESDFARRRLACQHTDNEPSVEVLHAMAQELDI